MQLFCRFHTAAAGLVRINFWAPTPESAPVKPPFL